MSRPTDPEIRRRLLEKAADFVLNHGKWDISLRSLAKPLGTNARMLIYHFRSRDGLMREILAALRERENLSVQNWFQQRSLWNTPSLPDFVRWYWRRMSSKQARPAVRLIFELYALALRDPDAFPGVLDEPVRYWRKLASLSKISKENADATATLLLAATRGLILDLAATGQRRRIDRALQILLQVIESHH